MTAPGEKAVHVSISGRVQGVWFRAWTEQEATARGLATVEAVFAGPSESVDDMVAACRNGPPLARVARVVVDDLVEDVGDDFRQVPTA